MRGQERISIHGDMDAPKMFDGLMSLDAVVASIHGATKSPTGGAATEIAKGLFQSMGGVGAPNHPDSF